jgi:hypothetical protein
VAGGAAVIGTIGKTAGLNFFAHGGKEWHIGVELASKFNILHLGKHLTYGIHVAVLYVGPMAARFHMYFLPYIKGYIKR